MPLVRIDQLVLSLRAVLDDKEEQGHDTAALRDRLLDPQGSVDTCLALAKHAARLPLRDGWPYDEPSDLTSIQEAADPHRVTGVLRSISTTDAEGRARAGFLGSVCGCILGKPVEANPTLDELQRALTAIGEWPLDDYISERLTTEGGFPRFNPTWSESVRERIRYVAPDDEINYTLLGYLVLDEHGLGFTRAELARTWLGNLAPGCTYGPERMAGRTWQPCSPGVMPASRTAAPASTERHRLARPRHPVGLRARPRRPVVRVAEVARRPRAVWRRMSRRLLGMTSTEPEPQHGDCGADEGDDDHQSRHSVALSTGGTLDSAGDRAADSRVTPVGSSARRC